MNSACVSVCTYRSVHNTHDFRDAICEEVRVQAMNNGDASANSGLIVEPDTRVGSQQFLDLGEMSGDQRLVRCYNMLTSRNSAKDNIFCTICKIQNGVVKLNINEIHEGLRPEYGYSPRHTTH